MLNKNKQVFATITLNVEAEGFSGKELQALLNSCVDEVRFKTNDNVIIKCECHDCYVDEFEEEDSEDLYINNIMDLELKSRQLG